MSAVGPTAKASERVAKSVEAIERAAKAIQSFQNGRLPGVIGAQQKIDSTQILESEASQAPKLLNCEV